jgi:4-hydroxythreonine-4-phosphate dehydrogenase
VSKRKPIIAVTSGDPAGIGPEIVASFFAAFRPSGSRALIIGAPKVFEPYLERMNEQFSVTREDEILRLGGVEAPVVLLDTGCRERYRPGRDSQGGGQHAGMGLELACRLANRGIVDGLVTAPISKRSLHMAGHRFAGHTELLAKRFTAPDCQMVMVYRKLRIVPLTRHVPIKKVSANLTVARIVTGVAVLHRALREQFGIDRPNIALAGHNPHAGEGGVLGREEIEVIEPAIRSLRRRRMRVTGPVPGDALFQHIPTGTFDAFVSMYHDQGLIPFKMLARRRGVNVTVGLPIVRTSVDHGVAYDIAGQDIASTVSLKAAYRLAEKLVRRRIISHSR